eukprot:COSAG05_NODE_9840_length_598_cov_0.847695_2_plen_183_part_01
MTYLPEAVASQQLVADDRRLSTEYGALYLMEESALLRAAMRNCVHRAAATLVRPQLVPSHNVEAATGTASGSRTWRLQDFTWGADIDSTSLVSRTAVVYRDAHESDIEQEEVYCVGLLDKSRSTQGADTLVMKKLQRHAVRRERSKHWLQYLEFDELKADVEVGVDMVATLMPWASRCIWAAS